jgi:hypothetical protein
MVEINVELIRTTQALRFLDLVWDIFFEKKKKVRLRRSTSACMHRVPTWNTGFSLVDFCSWEPYHKSILVERTLTIHRILSSPPPPNAELILAILTYIGHSNAFYFYILCASQHTFNGFKICTMFQFNNNLWVFKVESFEYFFIIIKF